MKMMLVSIASFLLGYISGKIYYYPKKETKNPFRKYLRKKSYFQRTQFEENILKDLFESPVIKLFEYGNYDNLLIVYKLEDTFFWIYSDVDAFSQRSEDYCIDVERILDDFERYGFFCDDFDEILNDDLHKYFDLDIIDKWYSFINQTYGPRKFQLYVLHNVKTYDTKIQQEFEHREKKRLDLETQQKECFDEFLETLKFLESPPVDDEFRAEKLSAKKRLLRYHVKNIQLDENLLSRVAIILQT